MVVIKRRPQLEEAQEEPPREVLVPGPCQGSLSPNRLVGSLSLLSLFAPHVAVGDLFCPKLFFFPGAVSSDARAAMSPLFTGINPPDFRGTGFVHLLSVKTGKIPPTTSPTSRPEPALRASLPTRAGAAPRGSWRGSAEPPPVLPLWPGPEPRRVPLSFRSCRRLSRPGPLLGSAPAPGPGPAAPSGGIGGQGSRWGGRARAPRSMQVNPRPGPARGLAVSPLVLPAAPGPEGAGMLPPSPPGKQGRDLGGERNFSFPVKGEKKKKKGVRRMAWPGQGLVLILILFLLLSWLYSCVSFWSCSSFCSGFYSYSNSSSWSWSWFWSRSYSYSYCLFLFLFLIPALVPVRGRGSPSDGLVRVSESRIDDHAGSLEMAPAAFLLFPPQFPPSLRR